jgi:hypothetical protein
LTPPDASIPATASDTTATSTMAPQIHRRFAFRDKMITRKPYKIMRQQRRPRRILGRRAARCQMLGSTSCS